jgi:hypothetical protein
MISVGYSHCKPRLIFSRHKLNACNIFVVDIAEYESPGTSYNSMILCLICVIPASLSFALPD